MAAKERATEAAQPESRDKDRQNLSDYRIILNEFSSRPQTMMEVTVKTCIPTQYICRYVGMLRDKGLIQIYRFAKCPVTGEQGVQHLTADPSLFKPMPKQLKLLFGNEQG